MHSRRTCRDRGGQVHRRRLRRCHDPVVSVLFLHPFRHRPGAAGQAEILSAAERAEMADVTKQIQKITCETPCCQYVCHLVFGVNVPDLNLRIQIDSVRQPIKGNSVGSRHMSHCWTPAFNHHFNHGFSVLKDLQHRIGQKFWCSKSTLSMWSKSELSYVVGAWVWFLVRLLDVVRCNRSSCANESLGFIAWFLVAMKTLQKPNSKDPELGYHPSANPRQEKLFQLPLNYEKLMSVSCTFNSLARACDFRRFHPMLILNLPDHQQNQNVEIIPIYIVVLCFPHDK